MNRAVLPVWRAVLQYTAFDLRSLPLWRFALMVGGPLLILLLFGVYSVVSSGFEPRADRRLVVATDQAAAASIEDWFEESHHHIEVVLALPDDVPSRLETGDLDLVVIVPEGFGAGAQAEIQLSKLAAPSRALSFQEQLLDWQLHEWTEARGGPMPDIVVVDQDGVVVEAEDEEAAGPSAIVSRFGLQDSTIRYVLGVMLVGMLGGMGGATTGVAVSTSRHKGFNHVLAVGTPRIAIYASEMLTGSVMMLCESLVWWMVYGAGLVLAVQAGELEAPAMTRVVLDLPLSALLTFVGFAQATTLGAGANQLSEDVSQKVKEQVRTLLFLGFIVGIQFSPRLFTPEVIGWLCGVPVVGPLSIWCHHIEGGAGLWWMIPLQVVYGGGALWLGGWLFGLDETPLAYLRRRGLRQAR